MKKLLVLAAMASVLAAQEPALAQNGPFSVNADCSFNQAVGQCGVYNQWMRPIFCDVRIRGRTMSGAWFTGRENVVVYPGQNAFAYVYAQNPGYDPLVDTAGSANCRF